MTHLPGILVAITVSFTATTVAAEPLTAYADYVAFVSPSGAQTTHEKALAVATTDPAGRQCFAMATSAGARELCQRYVQERALIEAIPTFALAARAKLALEAASLDEPWRADLIPIAQACADSADRLAATGIAPLRKVGPYTLGLVKSKLCNELLVSAGSEHEGAR